MPMVATMKPYTLFVVDDDMCQLQMITEVQSFMSICTPHSE